MGCTEWRQHQRDLLCVVLIGSDILQYLVIDTEGPKSSCSTHYPKHQETKSWMDLQQKLDFLKYLFI